MDDKNAAKAQPDMLRDIFFLQESLNDGIFDKCGIGNPIDGQLFMADMRAAATSGRSLGPNSCVNEWLSKFLRALQEEGKELEAELLWKWWSKDTLDMQNIRVEIVDMMHFLVSLALTAGLTADEFHRLYRAKHDVNTKRQEENYSRDTKNEADNKSII